jgi:trigger factor
MADDELTPAGDLANQGSAVAEAPPEGAKLQQTVEISDVGPCKKHIKVVVNRDAIDARFNDKYTELVRDISAPINGFRPGKAPRKVIERRFRSSVEEQVRTEVLMASLEQLATDFQIAPLSPPDLDPNSVEIPETGPLSYEFDVEVRPEFDLPSYRGLKLKRQVKQFTPADIEREQRRLLEPAGQVVPKEGADATVALDDFIIADVVIRDGERELNNLKEIRVRVQKQLALGDGLAEEFGKTLIGAKAGDERTVAIKLSESLEQESLRGKEVQATFKINDIKYVRLPELTTDILHEFGVRNEDQFQELIATVLERRLEHEQRQSFRDQVLGLLTQGVKLDLPQDLLIRQSKRVLARRVMEMRSAGMTDEQILGRRRVLEQNVVRSTAVALIEHFVMQKIAELEKIEIEEADIDAEIERIADRSGESARKVRARMEKDDLIEALAAEVLERRALDLVLASAEYEEVAATDMGAEDNVATVEAEAMPGASEPSPTAY